MPIHLFWGDDEAARNRAVDALIQQVCDPSWQSINLTRLDGNDQGQAAQAAVLQQRHQGLVVSDHVLAQPDLLLQAPPGIGVGPHG